MFNKNVLNLLSQVNGVTNSIILRYPKTVAISETQDMMVMFDVSELDSDEFPEIGLNNSLNDFLNLFKLFDEYKVEINDHVINITSGDSSVTYITDNISLMSIFDKDTTQFDKTEEVPSVAIFDLTDNDIKKLKSASNILKDLDEVIFTSSDGDVKIWIGATNKFNAKSNSFSVMKYCNATKDFEIKIPIENFKKIPTGDYTLEIKYNSSRDAYRILLKNKDLESFKLLLSVKV